MGVSPSRRTRSRLLAATPRSLARDNKSTTHECARSNTKKGIATFTNWETTEILLFQHWAAFGTWLFTGSMTHNLLPRILVVWKASHGASKKIPDLAKDQKPRVCRLSSPEMPSPSNWSLRSQWMFFAVASGACAAFNGFLQSCKYKRLFRVYSADRTMESSSWKEVALKDYDANLLRTTTQLTTNLSDSIAKLIGLSAHEQ
ncbi:hypothetical protein Lal_00015296 [Lupinus albus]|nr:hypothetical protein Lal_00015296 [Lupinus albus]